MRGPIRIMMIAFGLLVANMDAVGQTKALQKARQVKSKVKRYQRLFSSKDRKVTAEENFSDTIIWEKERYIPTRGTINDYEVLFRSLHGSHHKVLLKNTQGLNRIVYDSLTNAYYNRLDRINSLKDTNEVFGWHPYWMNDAYAGYNYNLLSTISYYAYDIDTETGGYVDVDAIDGWRTTPMIDTAHANGVNVLLTVTNYGEVANREFLTNQSLWQSLIDSLQVLLRERGGNGIDLNFEQVPTNLSAEYVSFIKKLRTDLADAMMLTVQVLPYNNGGAFDFSELNSWVDYFIIQGYDYSEVSCNSRPAPVAPLYAISSRCPCIANTFDYCVRNGMDMSKSILGLPLYGTKTTIRENSYVLDEYSYEYLTYSDILSSYASQYAATYDPVSGSAYFILPRAERGRLEMIWYEDEVSLDRKSQWALDQGMRGIALWALGYDSHHTSVKQVIASNFGIEPLQEITPIGYDNGKLYRLVEHFIKYKKQIGIGTAIILYFFLIGLFLSLHDYRVREVFFSNFTYRIFYAVIILVLLSVSTFLIKGGELNIWPLFLGLSLGALITYLVTKRYIMYRDKLP